MRGLLNRKHAGRTRDRRRTRGRLSCIAALTACASLFGQSSTSSLAQSWDKTKEELAKYGITPSFVYDGNLLTNAAGGIKPGSIFQGSFYAQMQIDGAKFFGVPGLTLFVSELVTHGPSPENGLVGDAQGVSNVTVRPGYRSYEGWVQYNFLNDHWSVLVGQYDLATEFYRSRTANLFFNYAFGTGTAFGLSGVEGPSIYPYTALGGRIAYKPTQNIVFRTAILDGVPLYRPPNDAVSPFRRDDGLLLISEAAWMRIDRPIDPSLKPHFRIGRFSGLPPYDDKVAFGGWYYTAKFPSLNQVDQFGNPLQKRDSAGAYMMIDKVLYETKDHSQQVSAFLQVGVAEQEVNRFGSYYGSGIAAAGLIPGRPKDEVGVAVAIARNGFSYMQSQMQQNIPVNRAETVIEATYLAQLNDWLAIQPDFQYVIHPNTDPTLRNAMVFQLRAEIAF